MLGTPGTPNWGLLFTEAAVWQPVWESCGEAASCLTELIRVFGGWKVSAVVYFKVNCTFVTYCIDEWSLRLTISIQSLVGQVIESCQMPKSWDFYT